MIVSISDELWWKRVQIAPKMLQKTRFFCSNPLLSSDNPHFRFLMLYFPTKIQFRAVFRVHKKPGSHPHLYISTFSSLRRFEKPTTSSYMPADSSLKSVQQSHFRSWFAFWHFNLQIGAQMRGPVAPHVKPLRKLKIEMQIEMKL